MSDINNGVCKTTVLWDTIKILTYGVRLMKYINTSYYYVRYVMYRFLCAVYYRCGTSLLCTDFW